MQWHARQESEVIQELESSEEGLKSGEAERRLEAYGENSIRQGEEVSPLKIFLSQFQGFLIYLLVFAALLSLGVGLLPHHSPEFTDAALILLILLANGIFGFVQDYKAEKSIEALKDMSQPDATVLRDGERAEVKPEGIVPGDVIVLEQGDAIPADARIIESSNLETDESALTGESEKVHKNPEVLDEDAALAERGNMVYMNTHVVKGRGKAVVVETGMETQVGEIAEQIEEAEEEKTPFQEEVDELGKRIGTGIMAIIALVGVIQFFATGNIIQVLLVAITLAVAAVPEGLPAVVTLTLAMGSKKMLEKNALVRSLPVVESLGSVNYIVTDKTGTLTEGEMTVTKLYYQDEEIEVTGGARGDGTFKKDSYRTEEEYLEPLLECGTICNNVREKDGEFQGEPTEVALMVSARKADIEPEGGREYEVPFSSDRKRMTVVQDGTAYMKGAPETVLERCDRILIDEEVRELDQEMRQRIKQENSEFASEALRVLGFARRDVENLASMKDDEIESGMVFLGLQGMIDPPRTEVPEAVNDCRNAGINVVMATGDNVETAKAIGEEIGFDSEAALTGPELDKMSEEEIGEAVRETEVFARVSPENKVDILEALQADGNNVAMTGDGVNDAPALKNSDVGVAMGQRGTDVAQQSSDMVLQDDNFATIRDAIAEGRGIFDNIRKFVNYLLSANAGEVLTVFFGLLIGTFLFPEVFTSENEALILTPVMLLWINFVTDGLPALAIGADPKTKGIMKRDPRGDDEPVINKRIMTSILGIGVLLTLAGLPLFFYAVAETGLGTAQTLLFTFIVVMELLVIQLIRRRYDQKLSSNKWLIGAVASSMMLQLAVLYTPLNTYFGVLPVSIEIWELIGLGGAGFALASLGMKKILDSRFGESL